MRLALIPCAQTEWRQEGRLLGRVELPLADQAAAQCAAWSEKLRELGLARIFSGPDELSEATAKLIGTQLGVVTKVLDDLVEVDIGLWSGLTEEQLKTRYAKAYRQLLDDPLSVAPPEGEAFAEAAERLQTCLKKKIKPTAKGDAGVVLRPFALALVRSSLEHLDPGGLWDLAQESDKPALVDWNGSAPADRPPPPAT